MPEFKVPDIPAEEVAHLAIEPGEVLEKILQGKSLFVVDVRRPGAAQLHPLQFGRKARILVRPYVEFGNPEEIVAALPGDGESLVVCATSRSARAAVRDLERAGAQVRYLLGGTRAWDQFMDVRTVLQTATGGLLQVARPGRGDLSYLVFSEGKAAILDPLRKYEHYLAVLAEKELQLAWVLDTHAHADHITGAPALARTAGVPYYLHPYDAIHPVDMLPAAIPFQPIQDGLPLQVGAALGRIHWFPGHTLGLSFLYLTLDDHALLFTGDGIFLNSIGRPDLGGKAENWAGLLYESINRPFLRELEDDTLVLPGHFSDFEDGDQGLYNAPLSRVRRRNSWLEGSERRAFISRAAANLPPVPEAYLQMKRINAGLSQASEEEALELEAGPNLCAVST